MQLKNIIKVTFNSRILGIVGLIFSSVLIVFFMDILSFSVELFEKYLSKDHSLEWTTHWYLVFSLVFMIFTIISVSICNLFKLWNKLFYFINSIVKLNEALEFFTFDNLCQRKSYTWYILFVGPFIGLIYFTYFLVFGIPTQEGIVENTNSLLLLYSFLILSVSVFRIKRLAIGKNTSLKILLLILFVSAVLFLLFGEEVSWGQHIFQWEAKGVFDSGYNFQRETNIHNFFNPLFKFVYPLFGAVFFIVLFFIWFFPNKNESYLFNLFVPHRSMFFLVFLMACASCLAGKETYEEIVAVFFLFYSFRIYMCLSYPANFGHTV